MKKILFAIALVLGVWAGSHTFPTNSALAQNGPFMGTVIPLTNQIAFTNTMVDVTNLPTLSMDDVITLLLTLQTNIEQTLPALAVVESNATFVKLSSDNTTQGFVAPITSNPASLFSGQTNPVSQGVVSFSLRIGTNTFDLDPATLQAIVRLQDDLARALSVVQALNGTLPTATNTISVTKTFLNPAVRSFAPPPFTGSFFVPLTNSSPFLSPGTQSAF
jgi:hypothetical protein